MISGKLVRLTTNAAGTAVTANTPLIEDWCQQYPSHSLGSLAFGAEGALYVTGGDGASFNGPDYGQLGASFGASSVTPVNPCGDPPNEGGALRSQDIRTTADPTGLGGTLLRIDPDTGDAWPDNANYGTGDANAQRIIAYGLRNPFRMTIRPGDGSVWLGDVGFNTTEEINTLPDPDAVRNFGWPCKEGSVTTPEYVNVISSLPLTLCTTLGSAWTPPAFQYAHSANVATGDGCGTGSSAIAGVTFRTTAGNYPSTYDNGLFFTDYTRKLHLVRAGRERDGRAELQPDRVVRQPPPDRRHVGRLGLRRDVRRPATSSTRTTTARRSERSTTTRRSRRTPRSPRRRPRGLRRSTSTSTRAGRATPTATR